MDSESLTKGNCNANPGRRSTYRRGDSVQTTGTSSHLLTEQRCDSRKRDEICQFDRIRPIRSIGRLDRLLFVGFRFGCAANSAHGWRPGYSHGALHDFGCSHQSYFQCRRRLNFSSARRHHYTDGNARVLCRVCRGRRPWRRHHRQRRLLGYSNWPSLQRFIKRRRIYGRWRSRLSSRQRCWVNIKRRAIHLKSQ